MKSILLTRGHIAVVDDQDYEVLSRFKLRALIQGSAPNVRVYAVCGNLRMHRVIWELAHGPISDGHEIDHIEPGEFCGLDNRRANLRLTTKSWNQANSRRGRNNTSGFKGVWWQKQVRRWRADILVNRKKVHVGYFDDPVEAAKAYDAAAAAAFGEHARLNFPAGRVA